MSSETGYKGFKIEEPSIIDREYYWFNPLDMDEHGFAYTKKECIDAIDALLEATESLAARITKLEAQRGQG